MSRPINHSKKKLPLDKMEFIKDRKPIKGAWQPHDPKNGRSLSPEEIRQICLEKNYPIPSNDNSIGIVKSDD